MDNSEHNPPVYKYKNKMNNQNVLMKTQDKSKGKSGSRPKHWSLQVVNSFKLGIVIAVVQNYIQHHRHLFIYFFSYKQLKLVT